MLCVLCKARVPHSLAKPLGQWGLHAAHAVHAVCGMHGVCALSHASSPLPILTNPDSGRAIHPQP